MADSHTTVYCPLCYIVQRVLRSYKPRHTCACILFREAHVNDRPLPRLLVQQEKAVSGLIYRHNYHHGW